MLRWRAEHPSGRGNRRAGEGRVASGANAGADAHRNGSTDQQRALLKAEAWEEMLGETTVSPADGLLRRVLGQHLSPFRARAFRAASGLLEDPHSFITEQQREHQRPSLLEVVHPQAVNLGHGQAEERRGFRGRRRSRRPRWRQTRPFPRPERPLTRRQSRRLR